MGGSKSEFGEKKTVAKCPCCKRGHVVMMNYTGIGTPWKVCPKCKSLFENDYTPEAYPRTRRMMREK